MALEKRQAKRTRTADKLVEEHDTAASSDHASIADPSGVTNSTSQSKRSVKKGPFRITKRVPQRLPTQENDIYVSSKSNFMAQYRRAETLLESERFSTVVIHGLAATMNKAIDLALRLERQSFGAYQLSVTTSTVSLVDDMDPLDQDELPSTQERLNSAVHIAVSKKKS